MLPNSLQIVNETCSGSDGLSVGQMSCAKLNSYTLQAVNKGPAAAPAGLNELTVAGVKNRAQNGPNQPGDNFVVSSFTPAGLAIETLQIYIPFQFSCQQGCEYCQNQKDYCVTCTALYVHDPTANTCVLSCPVAHVLLGKAIAPRA